MDYFKVFDSENPLTAHILELDQTLQRLLRLTWPEALVQLALPLGSIRALLAIADHNARTPRQVADVLDVSRTTVTGMLDRLEVEGLITRSLDMADRRSFILELTPAGLSLLRQIDEVRQTQLRDALAHMDTEALAALEKGLSALVAAKRISTPTLHVATSEAN